MFLAARDLFPNVLIVIRDPAHAIRIASKALHCDDVFGEVWHELFDARHALVPDLKNSDKWNNLLVAIQEDNNVRTVAVPGMSLPGMPQPLAGILKKVSFAKQRFDSTADPVAKVALMLLPVAVLLAYIASDVRNEKEQRERAEALLRKLDTKFCAAIAVSADWGMICTWFLRFFDAVNHDIAMSRADIDCMIETLDACFLEGRVFQRLLDNSAGSAAKAAALARHVTEQESLPPLPKDVTQGVTVGFITEKVLRQPVKSVCFTHEARLCSCGGSQRRLRRRSSFIDCRMWHIWQKSASSPTSRRMMFAQRWRCLIGVLCGRGLAPCPTLTCGKSCCVARFRLVPPSGSRKQRC